MDGHSWLVARASDKERRLRWAESRFVGTGELFGGYELREVQRGNRTITLLNT